MQSSTPTIIRGESSGFQWNFKELWQYRDLLKLLIRRDFLTKYRQTILGPLWFLIQPLLVVGVFAIIFHKIAGLSTQAIPPMLFYLTGWMGWNYLAQILSTSATVFVSNADIFHKIYFPRLIMPLANVASNLFMIIIQMVLWIGIWTYYAMQPENWLHIRWEWLWAPLIFLHLGCIAFGVSLIFSALTARYRDLNHLIPTLLQLWMYGSAIIYPLAQVPAAYRVLLMWNPVCAPIEGLRVALFGMGECPFELYAISIGLTILLITAGLYLFQKTERYATDTT
jgi:lipopolysaccharide transport system permease protein